MLLTLRPLTLDDTAAVHEWPRLPESCRYQAWGPNTYEQTREYVRAVVTASSARATPATSPRQRCCARSVCDMRADAWHRVHSRRLARLGSVRDPRRRLSPGLTT